MGGLEADVLPCEPTRRTRDMALNDPNLQEIVERQIAQQQKRQPSLYFALQNDIEQNSPVVHSVVQGMLAARCSQCHKPPPLSRCTQCHTTYYCGEECYTLNPCKCPILMDFFGPNTVIRTQDWQVDTCYHRLFNVVVRFPNSFTSNLGTLSKYRKRIDSTYADLCDTKWIASTTLEMMCPGWKGDGTQRVSVFGTDVRGTVLRTVSYHTDQRWNSVGWPVLYQHATVNERIGVVVAQSTAANMTIVAVDDSFAERHIDMEVRGMTMADTYRLQDDEVWDLDPATQEAHYKSNGARYMNKNRCGWCGCSSNGHRMSRCGRCMNETYCSVACQRSDWLAGHKQVCTI